MTFAKTDEIKTQFRRLDWNHDGTLDYEEMCKLLKTGKQEMKADEMELLFRSMDKNSDGRINFDEFVDWVHTDVKAASLLAEATPGPGSYRPETSPEVRHRRPSAASIGLGPGHERPLSRAATPGPGQYTGDDRLQAHHARFPVATFGHGPGHETSTQEVTPGPGSYHGDDRVDSRHRYSGSAVIGRGPARRPLSGALRYRSATPGPASYNADDRLQAHHRRAASATMGRGPGHRPLSAVVAGGAQSLSPGPAAYDTQGSWKSLSRAQTSHGGTFGRGPGHSNEARPSSLGPSSSPGPADYNNDSSFSTRRVRSASAFFAGAGRGQATREERDKFRAADRNRDGRLDFDEIALLLRRGNPKMPESRIRSLFEAVDKNHDGRIDFNELIDYIHLGSAPHEGSSDRLKAAFAASAPGPGAYDTRPASRPISGGSFSRAAR
mmetsp:Transcript_158485/g.279768  ORF Transcript_158485/g.279768 Transcript_158485/m.279768 type:complete len:438 (+) Transcript_158485:81-1394(+)